MISHESARHWLGIIEPLQLGYGAVIISFLGAIHWGLEYAEKTPSRGRTRFRYGLGVLASAVAWPTVFMPVEFALTTQFGALVALYWADTLAARRGWAPPWYGTYRFVLTAVAGAAIALSLIGRAKVGDAAPRLSGLDHKIRERRQGEQNYDAKWVSMHRTPGSGDRFGQPANLPRSQEKLETEEREKIKKEKEEKEKEKEKQEEEGKNGDKGKKEGERGKESNEKGGEEKKK